MGHSRIAPFMVAVVLGVTCVPTTALASNGQTAEIKNEQSNELSKKVNGVSRLRVGDNTLDKAMELVKAHQLDGNNSKVKFIINGQNKSGSIKFTDEFKKMMSTINSEANRLSGYLYSMHYGYWSGLNMSGLEKDERVIAVWLTTSDEMVEKNKIARQHARELANKAKAHSRDVREQLEFINSYLVDNTEYDSYAAANRNNVGRMPWTAYNVFVEHKGVCAAYSNAVTLTCEELGIPVIEIYSEDHEWNMVYVDGQWYHLDVTWNDPVWKSTPSQSRIEERKLKYFLIHPDKFTDHEKAIDDWKAVVQAKYPELADMHTVEWDGIVKDIQSNETNSNILTKNVLAEVIAKTDGMMLLERNKELYTKLCDEAFIDVDEANKVYVGYLLDKGVIEKSEDKHFSGNVNVTVGELSIAIAKLNGTEYSIKDGTANKGIATYKDLEKEVYIPEKQVSFTHTPSIWDDTVITAEGCNYGI